MVTLSPFGSMLKTEALSTLQVQVKSLVKLHDGEVTVDSEIGKWTEFNIKIPNRTSIKESIDTYEKDLDRVEKIRIEFSDIYAQAIRINIYK